MKSFEAVTFDATQCRLELTEFGNLLRGGAALHERGIIAPFFSQRKQLSSFIGTFTNGRPDLLAYEWAIHGDFVADIAVGNRNNKTFCMVELEAAASDCIFSARGSRSTRTWNRAFERGFSQLVDWFYAYDDFSHTRAFADDFGPGHVKFHGLLVIGRSAELSEPDLRRLRWREERVVVNSHPIHCITYDELHDELSQYLEMYPAGAAPVD